MSMNFNINVNIWKKIIDPKMSVRKEENTQTSKDSLKSNNQPQDINPTPPSVSGSSILATYAQAMIATGGSVPHGKENWSTSWDTQKDENGNITSETIINTNKTTGEKKETTTYYNENGSIRHNIDYDANGNITGWVVTSYDKNGNLESTKTMIIDPATGNVTDPNTGNVINQGSGDKAGSKESILQTEDSPAAEQSTPTTPATQTEEVPAAEQSTPTTPATQTEEVPAEEPVSAPKTEKQIEADWKYSPLECTHHENGNLATSTSTRINEKTGEKKVCFINYNEQGIWTDMTLTEYDSNGNVTRITETVFDENGNVTSSIVKTIDPETGNVISEQNEQDTQTESASQTENAPKKGITPTVKPDTTGTPNSYFLEGSDMKTDLPRSEDGKLIPVGQLTIGEDGKLYYTNADGEKIEFEYDPELVEKYENNFINTIKGTSGYENEEEKLQSQAAYQYFQYITAEKRGMSLEDLAGDQGVPTSVSTEEYAKILEKLDNFEIPTDYEFAQLKFYEQQQVTQQAQNMMNSNALNNVTRTEEGNIIYTFADGMSSSPTINSICVTSDGTVMFNGEATNLSAADMEAFNKKCYNELKALMDQSSNVQGPFPTAYGGTVTSYQMNNSKDFINYIVEADGSITINYMKWDPSKNDYVQTKGARLNY